MHGLLQTAPHVLGVPLLVNLPAFGIVIAITWLLLRGARGSTANNVMVMIKLAALGLFIAGVTHLNPANYVPFAPNGFTGIHQGAAIVFFAYIGFDAILPPPKNPRSPAQSAHRHPRRPRDLHADLRRGRRRADRHGAVPSWRTRPTRWRTRCRPPGSSAWAGSWRSARRSRWRPCCWCSSSGSRASSSRWPAMACCPAGRRACTRARVSRATTLLTGLVVAIAALIGDAAETYDLTNIGTFSPSRSCASAC